MIATNIRPKMIDLEKQQRALLRNSFYASTLQDYVEEGLLFQNIPKPKITHADPDRIFLAIAQNWAMRLFVGFVMQGHMCRPPNYPAFGGKCTLFCYFSAIPIFNLIIPLN